MNKLNLAIWLPPNYDPTSPSVRLRRLNLRKPLRAIGVRAEIVFRFEDLHSFDHILLMTFDDLIVRQCIELRKLGKKLYFCHSEQIFGLDYQDIVFNLCDYIVCCSSKLAEVTLPHIKSGFTECVVIEDMLEGPRPLHQPVDKEKLKVVWTGMGGNSYLAKAIKPIIEDLGMELIIISEHDDANIKWSRDTYLFEMAKCDIAICPQNVALQPAKSHVKVATAMGLGMPFVCSPSPAYSEIVEHGVNGYFASTPEEWKTALSALKDFETRKRVAAASKKSSIRFEPETIAANWKSLLLRKKTTIALINDSLPVKYMSYGDKLLEDLRLAGYEVECFRYEDIDCLPSDFDYYLFVEVRYDPYKIKEVGPKVLFTRELCNPNLLVPFNYIITDHSQVLEILQKRGFTNTVFGSLKTLQETSPSSFLQRRKKHNFQLHTNNTNALRAFHLPEERWNGSLRDRLHIQFVNQNLSKNCQVLDVGSADGWLSLYCASQGMSVAALDFVERGIAWTKEQAARLQVAVDVRKGHTEDVVEIFKDQLGQFDAVLLFEILEHVEFTMVPWYLGQLEKLLKSGGKILVSLPKQDMISNIEHLWSPSDQLIDQIFAGKHCYTRQWIPIPNHEVEGNWFISYSTGFTSSEF